jgi:hypothetical protein
MDGERLEEVNRLGRGRSPKPNNNAFVIIV